MDGHVPFTYPSFGQGEYGKYISIDKGSNGKSIALGGGTYGCVFRGKVSLTGEVQIQKNIIPVALKILNPTELPDSMTVSEINALRLLNGKNNTIEMYFYIVDDLTKAITLVFPLVEHTPFKELLIDATEPEVLAYMEDLVKGLQYMHQSNLIHRDIKCTNYLFNRCTRVGVVIDFGFATFMSEATEGFTNDPRWTGDYATKPVSFYGQSAEVLPQTATGRGVEAVRAKLHGSHGYLSPEIMLECEVISSATDIFACGAILVKLLLRKKEFFIQNTKAEGIIELMCLYGADRVVEVAFNLGKTLTCGSAENSKAAKESFNIDSFLPEPMAFKGTLSTLTEKQIIQNLRPKNSPFNVGMFSLLSRFLSLSPVKRYTATKALRDIQVLKTNSSRETEKSR